MRNILANMFEWLSDKCRKAIYLDEYDFIEMGWKRIEYKGIWYTFTKDKYTVKFNKKSRKVSLKTGKQPTFYGIVNTVRDFNYAFELNTKKNK